MTLLYFPVCVILAWIADRRLLFYKYMHKRYRADKRHGIVVEMEGDVIMDGKLSDGTPCPENSSSVTVSVQSGNELDQNKDGVRSMLSAKGQMQLLQGTKWQSADSRMLSRRLTNKSSKTIISLENVYF